MEDNTLVWSTAWALIGGGVGVAIGSRRNRTGVGFALGLFLGFIGWIIVAVLPENPVRRCPACMGKLLPFSMGARDSFTQPAFSFLVEIRNTLNINHIQSQKLKPNN